jgi:hypothetical protein
VELVRGMAILSWPIDWSSLFSSYFMIAAGFTLICIAAVLFYQFSMYFLPCDVIHSLAAFKLKIELTSNFNKDDWVGVHSVSDLVKLDFALFTTRYFHFILILCIRSFVATLLNSLS